jgi:hypothetical protein
MRWGGGMAALCCAGSLWLAGPVTWPPPVASAPRLADERAPAVDLPPALREANWGGGSCVHASTVHLLHWQGEHDLAAWWRRHYRGGEYASRLHARLEQAGLRYAYTVRGDVGFLEWALRTRRGAGITYYPQHAVNLVHLDDEWAGLLDNNRIERIVWVRRDEFVRRWQAYGGWAWTLVYDPPPPIPFIEE